MEEINHMLRQNSHHLASSDESKQVATSCLRTDLICLSHLRWDFVFQRPQHLMTRFACHRRVFFIEEPVFGQTAEPRMDITSRGENLFVVVPQLPESVLSGAVNDVLRDLMNRFITEEVIEKYTFWYYTPMALSFTNHLSPERVIYDCMDELSLFKGAPQQLLDYEEELFETADHVFTGGQSLYEAKRDRHHSVHAFPSSIDFTHFAKSRTHTEEPEDQKSIPHPRVGFFGVIDERADLELIAGIARLRPEWNVVLIGPVVKIDSNALPQADNIHYLGMKSYSELPAYLAGWRLAMLPFAMNESTRFISPTKTPEYLAAGCPVVSTPIRDVVRPYGEQGLVHIAANTEDFVESAELAMHEKRSDPSWQVRVDNFLANTSWDQTWARMARLESRIEASVDEIETQDLVEDAHLASLSIQTGRETPSLRV